MEKISSELLEDNPEYYDLVEQYLTFLEKELDHLKALLQQNEVTNFKLLCHKLKGSSITYGYPELNSVFIELYDMDNLENKKVSSLLHRADLLMIGMKSWFHSLK